MDTTADANDELLRCADRCLAVWDCVGFEFPKMEELKSWDTAVAGPTMCTLKVDPQEVGSSLACCPGTKLSSQWTLYALADASQTRWNSQELVVRALDKRVWKGPEHVTTGNWIYEIMAMTAKLCIPAALVVVPSF